MGVSKRTTAFFKFQVCLDRIFSFHSVNLPNMLLKIFLWRFREGSAICTGVLCAL
jgi:hypothetical protein